MDLIDVIRACVRRWYVLIPLLAIVVWFSYSSYSAIKPVYYANALISVAPPSTRIDNAPAGVAIPRNGLLDVGGAALIANMATFSLREPSVVDEVIAAGGQSNYTVRLLPAQGTTAPQPVIMIEAYEANPTDVTTTLELVIAKADTSLHNLQQHARVPEDQMVVPFVVSPPGAPAAEMPSSPARLAITMFAGGLVAAVLAALLVDALLGRRARWIKARAARTTPTVAGPACDYTATDIAKRDGAMPINHSPVDAR